MAHRVVNVFMGKLLSKIINQNVALAITCRYTPNTCYAG
jgi:hypothetical protein